jgi:LDH2 family malate/lactate/ureidoglycolate dehydrogenase
LFDAATSVVPIGKIEVYAKQGKKILLGWAISPEGKLLDDPKEILTKRVHCFHSEALVKILGDTKEPV